MLCRLRDIKLFVYIWVLSCMCVLCTLLLGVLCVSIIIFLLHIYEHIQTGFFFFPLYYLYFINSTEIYIQVKSRSTPLEWDYLNFRIIYKIYQLSTYNLLLFCCYKKHCFVYLFIIIYFVYCSNSSPKFHITRILTKRII